METKKFLCIIFFNLIFILTSQCGYYYYPHFINVVTEAEKYSVTISQSRLNGLSGFVRRSGKESASQCKRHKRPGFSTWGWEDPLE